MTDPRLVPAMDNAHQYTSYLHFMTAHRHRLQRSVIFQEWDTPLQRLIEKEASRLGLKLEDSRQWEIVETSLSIPLHCAFWFGWETVHNLKTKFDKAIELHNCKQAAVENAVALSPLLSRMNRLDQPDHIDDSLESDVTKHGSPAGNTPINIGWWLKNLTLVMVFSHFAPCLAQLGSEITHPVAFYEFLRVGCCESRKTGLLFQFA